MNYVHIRNLEKYHIGYKDRKLIWAKIYFNMVQGDPDCEMITNEIDWGRLIKFILLELQARKPIPLDEKYLTKKGFDLKSRKIELTLQALSMFIELKTENVTEPLQDCNAEKRREENIKKSREYEAFENALLLQWNSFVMENPSLPKIKEVSKKRREKIKLRYESESFRDFSKILEAIKKQDFCLGNNDRNWKVSIDWLIENDTNYLKVLELKYLKSELQPRKPKEIDTTYYEKLFNKGEECSTK